MIIPSKCIQSNNIQPPFNSWDQKEDMQGRPSTIIVKALMKDHRTSNFQSSKVKVGAVSHIYMSKKIHN